MQGIFMPRTRQIFGYTLHYTPIVWCIQATGMLIHHPHFPWRWLAGYWLAHHTMTLTAPRVHAHLWIWTYIHTFAGVCVVTNSYIICVCALVCICSFAYCSNISSTRLFWWTHTRERLKAFCNFCTYRNCSHTRCDGLGLHGVVSMLLQGTKIQTNSQPVDAMVSWPYWSMLLKLSEVVYLRQY